MRIPIELLRSYTLPKLHEVTAREESTFKAWITNCKYTISCPTDKDKFTLDVSSSAELVNSFAFDINRMACASFESIAGIQKEIKFPKSIGWIVIRLYYAAYFSAHAILRIYGRSCSQFDNKETAAINKVAKLFDQKKDSVSQGYFLSVYDKSKSAVDCSKLDSSHKGVWLAFNELLHNLGDKIPKSSYLKEDKDNAINHLYNLKELLSQKGTHRSGTWLSNIRNEVNYTHSWGAWFPHSSSYNLHTEIIRNISNWNPERFGYLPMLEVTSKREEPLDFVDACISVITLCKELVLDIHKLNKQNFLKNRSVKCLNLCSISSHHTNP